MIRHKSSANTQDEMVVIALRVQFSFREYLNEQIRQSHIETMGKA